MKKKSIAKALWLCSIWCCNSSHLCLNHSTQLQTSQGWQLHNFVKLSFSYRDKNGRSGSRLFYSRITCFAANAYFEQVRMLMAPTMYGTIKLHTHAFTKAIIQLSSITSINICILTLTLTTCARCSFCVVLLSNR